MYIYTFNNLTFQRNHIVYGLFLEVPDAPVESFVDWPLHKGSMSLAENDEKRLDYCEDVPEATGFCHLQQDSTGNNYTEVPWPIRVPQVRTTNS